MATQTVEFPASSGLTLAAKLYPVGSDTASATASSTVESTNRKGIYVGTFTNLVGDYLLVAEDAGSVPACVDPLTGTANTATTYQTESIKNYQSANALQFAGQAITAAAGVTLPSSVASPTNITAGTITTVTNLTNAPTAGDLTSTMKTSAQTAADAAITANALIGTVEGHAANADSQSAALPSLSQILTTAMTESYAANGAAPSLSQAIFLIQQVLTEFAISGTTLTIKKKDHSTTAATLTLNDATNPSAATRAS